VGGQRHYPQEGAPIPTVEEAGWAPRPVCIGAENVSATGVRSPNRLTRSDSLYRLSPPSSLLGVLIITTLINCNIWIHVITDLCICKEGHYRSVAMCSGLSGDFLKFSEIVFTVQLQRNRKRHLAAHTVSWAPDDGRVTLETCRILLSIKSTKAASLWLLIWSLCNRKRNILHFIDRASCNDSC